MAMFALLILFQRYTNSFLEPLSEYFSYYDFYFNRHFFTIEASQYYCICFVTGHSQWRTTPSWPVPRIFSNLDSWI